MQKTFRSIRAGKRGVVRMGNKDIQSSLHAAGLLLAGAATTLIFAIPLYAQESAGHNAEQLPAHLYQQTTSEYNSRLDEINRKLSQHSSLPSAADYRIGPDDQLGINVLEALELNREPRVSATGEISLPLIGTVHAEDLTPRELELVIEELLRRSYIKNPHVDVQVRDIKSHPVAVFGAVKKPGVFQIRQPKTLIELLSLAEGLDIDAGDSVIVEHRAESFKAAATPGGDDQSPVFQSSPSGTAADN